MDAREKLAKIKERLSRGQGRRSFDADRTRAMVVQLSAANIPLPEDYASPGLLGDALTASLGDGDDAHAATGRISAYFARKAMKKGDDA